MYSVSIAALSSGMPVNAAIVSLMREKLRMPSAGSGTSAGGGGGDDGATASASAEARAERFELEMEPIRVGPLRHRDHGAEPRQLRARGEHGRIDAAERLRGDRHGIVDGDADVLHAHARRAADERRLREHDSSRRRLRAASMSTRPGAPRMRRDVELQRHVLADAGREILLHLRGRQRLVVDRDDLERA